jgi:hypothetical protein
MVDPLACSGRFAAGHVLSDQAPADEQSGSDAVAVALDMHREMAVC